MTLTETLEQTREKIRSGKFGESELARGAGVSRFTIRNIASGKTPNPGILTIEKILNFIGENN